MKNVLLVHCDDTESCEKWVDGYISCVILVGGIRETLDTYTEVGAITPE